MQLVNLTITKRNSEVIGSVATGFDVDDFIGPIRYDSNRSRALFTMRLTETDPRVFAQAQYEANNTLAAIASQVPNLIRVTVVTRNGIDASNEVMVFNAKKISESIVPVTTGTKFMYIEEGDPSPVEYIVSETVSNIVTQTSLSGDAWALNGNTVTAEKWIGTADDFEFPIRVNNAERARFSKTAFILKDTINILSEDGRSYVLLGSGNSMTIGNDDAPYTSYLQFAPAATILVWDDGVETAEFNIKAADAVIAHSQVIGLRAPIVKLGPANLFTSSATGKTQIDMSATGDEFWVTTDGGNEAEAALYMSSTQFDIGFGNYGASLTMSAAVTQMKNTTEARIASPIIRLYDPNDVNVGSFYAASQESGIYLAAAAAIVVSDTALPTQTNYICVNADGITVKHSAITTFDTPKINMAGLQIGDAGLSAGDLYVDTSANILANGDLVVARKV